MIASYRNMRRLVCLAGLLAVLCCGTAAAAEPARKTVSPAPAAPATQAADALETTPPAVVPAPLEVFNRTVTVFRSSYFGVAPADRVVRARQELLRVLAKGGPGRVSTEATPHGRVILLDGELVFTLFPKDVDPLGGETLDQAAEKTVKQLSQVVAETREARNVSTMFRAGGKASLATVVLLLLVWALHRIRVWIAARILPLVQEKSSKLRVDGEVLFNGDFVLKVVTWLFAAFYWFATLLLVYQWLVYSMGLFPYTRPWGERLMQYLLTVAGNIANGMLTAIPRLLIAFLIFLIANYIVKLLNSFFDRVKSGNIELTWLDEDTVRPTRRLVAGAIWVFALAMAYPYLPGAETQAFKGLSVLLGLMLSLGASSLVGQAASGLILMYTRTMRAGEYVSISDKEGTVVELGLFTTRLRNGMGEELTLPNSLVLGTVTKNYSRMVHGSGFILTTTVTIGYDTPWRQIHAMLLEAARRTEGVLADPPPRVFQLALSDYYPEYRLVCQAIPSSPLPRAEVLTALHANIQDVFNEYGVQIMSPHYMGDPAEAKVVPKEGWYAPPAIPPAGE